MIELQDEMDRVEHLIDSEAVSKALLKQWMALRRQLRRKVEIGEQIHVMCAKLRSLRNVEPFSV